MSNKTMRVLQEVSKAQGVRTPSVKSAGYDATAPRQGNCRGRASRVRAVPAAILKRASCGVSPVARPLAAPADWETASGGLGNLWKFYTTAHNFPSFSMLRSSLPNPAGGGRRPCAVMARRAKRSFSPPRQDCAKCASRIPRRFPKFGAVAPMRNVSGASDESEFPVPHSPFPVPEKEH